MIIDVLQTQSVDYWKQERLILTMQVDDNTCKVSFWSNLQGSQGSPIATYTAAGSSTYGDVDIDLTDYVRAYPSVTTLYIRDISRSTTHTISITVKGLINPASVIIPYHFGNAYVAVIPPYNMIAPTTGKSLIAENFNIGAGASVTGNATMAGNGRYITITGDFSYKAVPYGDARAYKLRSRLCGTEYAFVRWVSFSGVTRVHLFEVCKPTIAAAENYNLLPVDNEYIEVKGRVDSLTLRLTDLCAYDMWYYADVITSSKVEVSLDGTTYTQVQVTTKNITLPDGDTKTSGKLEMAVNWKRYDAVAM